MTGHRHTRILLSGGIGAGKSAAARIIAARGYPVIHADKIGHAVLEPEGEAFPAVAARWPEVVVDGMIDRPRLAEIVFDDPAALAELESLTHPAIAARIMNLVERESDAGLVAVELPVLLPILGDGWTRVVVDAPLEVRIQRLRDRGMEDADIEARMAAQPSRGEWRTAADHILKNHGSLRDLEAEVDRLLEALAPDR
ncbi:MAG: dephospho-CoA kinase [Acidimicrobiales bacterium]|nr:dephospho-CoA kinase [Acidimicrobiales bacterium]NNF10592.1 dephospho-CoA kinase [Acidimicrobiia bacterium]